MQFAIGASTGIQRNVIKRRLFSSCVRIISRMSTEAASLFVDKHLDLLSQERDAEIGRTSLVFSKCGPKLLEQKGLALNGLGVASVGVGLGNKT